VKGCKEQSVSICTETGISEVVIGPVWVKYEARSLPTAKRKLLSHGFSHYGSHPCVQVGAKFSSIIWNIAVSAHNSRKSDLI
jgi:hypothetical protein